MTYRLIHDGLLDHPVLRGTGTRQRAYSDTEAFIWLIQTATRGEVETSIGGKPARLKDGQLSYSFRYIAKAFGWTTAHVQRYLDKLKRHGMADTGQINGQLLVTICKFWIYQNPSRADEPVADTPEKPQPIHHRYKYQQESNKKTIEPDGSIDPVSEPANDRHGLGTKDALPGQLAFDVVAELPPMTAPDAPPEPPPRPNAGVVPMPAAPKRAEVAEEMRAIWNEVCGDAMPPIRALSARRVTGMTNALRRQFGNDLGRWRAYCERLRASPFMCGDNDRGWLGNIDTCITEKTIIRTFEGCYDQRDTNRPRTAGVVRGAAATMELAERWLGSGA